MSEHWYDASERRFGHKLDAVVAKARDNIKEQDTKDFLIETGYSEHPDVIAAFASAEPGESDAEILAKANPIIGAELTRINFGLDLMGEQSEQEQLAQQNFAQGAGEVADRIDAMRAHDHSLGD